jgi:alpha/beta hydrolase fold
MNVNPQAIAAMRAVTISREYGSGGGEIAARLARRLNWQLIEVGPLVIADGQQAMKVVRQHASQWGLASDRIGIMGFSAGGRVTVGVALEHDAASRPNFGASIYGTLWEDITVPADAPPPQTRAWASLSMKH